MSIQPSSASPQPQHMKWDFTIDLSQFSHNIKSNFTMIWNTLNQQAKQIQILKAFTQRGNINNQTGNVQEKRYAESRGKVSENISLNLSQASIGEMEREGSMKQSNMNPQNTKDQQQNMKLNKQKQDQKEGAENKKLKSKQKQNQRSKSKSKPYIKADTNINIKKQESQTLPENINESQNKNEKESKQINNEMLLIEKKIFEMNERLQKIELTAVKDNSAFSKKMNFLNIEINRAIETVDKKQNQMKKLQFLIQKLRGELSEYKIKKQAKFMKMAASNNNSSGSNNEFNEFILEKIQQISDTMPHLLPKQDFEQYKAQTKIRLARLEKRINEFVTNAQFEDLITIISKKNHKPKLQNVGEGQKIQNNQQEQDEINPIIEFKINNLQKTIKTIQDYLQQNKIVTEESKQKTNEKLKEHSHKLEDILKQLEKSNQKLTQHEEFMRNMNASYNQKFKDMVNQMIQAQEAIQRLNSQMKSLTYINTDPNNPGTPSQIDKSKLNEIDVDLGELKKKVNKMFLKMQTMKEEMTTFIQDFGRDLDIVKVAVEKKCDWESFKQGIQHLEERTKEIQNYIGILQQNIINSSETTQNNTSTAAKKGWTCLCCDKDIKQFEGKLSEAKFTSIFPAKYQSPRIGGYYKQKEGSKEYNQIFIKHNRRLSQNQSQMSQLQPIKTRQDV